MNSKKQERVYVVDTSAILSGKPLNLEMGTLITSPGVSNELKPGGKDYQAFLFLQEKGLTIKHPSENSVKKIHQIATETGDIGRLSKADIEILALAADFCQEKEVVILTDDYSIQNVAHVLHITFETVSQPGITKRFKWIYQCSGCRKKFKENIKICPICGASTKNIISHKNNIER